MNDLTTTLTDLASRINAEHERFEAALKTGLQHAHNAGQLLLDAKGRLQHGQWLPWLKAHCKVTDRTARRYMQIADRWEELLQAAPVTELTFHQAIHLLTHTPDDHLKVSGKTDTVSDLTEKFRCATCGEELDREVWHCPGCGKHLTPDVATCPECEAVRPGTDTDRRQQLLDLRILCSNDTVAGRRKRVELWWDLLADPTLILDANGWSAAEIADHFGVPEKDVHAILDPQAPLRFDTPENGSDFPENADDAYRRAFRAAYRETVEGITAGMLWAVTLQAERTARDGDLTDTEDELAARGRALYRRHTRLLEKASRFWAHEDFGFAFYFSARCDARAALRIEDLEENGTVSGFLDLWDMQLWLRNQEYQEGVKPWRSHQWQAMRRCDAKGA